MTGCNATRSVIQGVRPMGIWQSNPVFALFVRAHRRSRIPSAGSDRHLGTQKCARDGDQNRR